MTEDEQTKNAFTAPNRRDAYLKARAETPEQKGLSYTDLLVDNIVGLDNEYESFGEAFGKSFNEDELGTLKNMALSAYEGAKEFVTSPIETTKDVATEISDSVSRLGAESLDGRIKRMYGVGYQDATEEQVTKAREAVIGDAITASSLVPAAKGVITVAKAAIPGRVQADVVGQMRSIIDGDKEFRTESTKPAQGLSADVVGAPYKPKMFSSGEVGIKPGAYSVAEFYSPTVETLRNTEFPSKGYKGSELLKLLQDKTPGVRKAELSTMDLGIDPQKRYSKDEVLGLAERRSYKVTAEVQDADPNQDTQRQILRDQEVDYATIKINASPASEEIASFFPTRGYTHYDPETIAHTRVSVREDQNGAEYLLVEELQSDLLQHGAAKPRGPISTDDAYEEVLDILAEDISKEPDFKDLYENNQKYFDNLFKVGAENSRLYGLRGRGTSVSQEEMDSYNALVEETRGMADNLGEAPYEKGFQRLATFLENAGYEEGYRIERRTKAIGPSPVTEDSDTVRMALQAAMAKASDSDVSSIVIPNVQRIIAADRARPGSEEYEKYVQPGSGFQRTYVKGVEKFIKQLQAEYGDAIKIEKVELPYIKEKLYYQGQEVDVPNTAIKIDFSGLKGVDLRVGRFAEGGMVEDQQMNRLMQEGGMTDDGMNIEPVTGNEIPPGSMASEVRDDIPAQLSEGEYVVPADVVRFFGVRFFEDLRSQAKQGLQEMDADGRIGGTPVNSEGVPMEGNDELSLEEEQMLMEALGASGTGMAYGGMVQQQVTTPYQDQATLYKMPEGMGMAEGGVADFDRTKFTLSDNAVSGGIESRRYINPTTKEERTVQFLNGMPLGLIPEGFVPWSQEIATTPTTPVTPTAPVETAPVETRREGGADRANEPTTGSTGSTGGGSGGWAEKNYDAITKDPFTFGMEALTGASDNKLGFLGKTPIGGVFNDAGKITALGNANAALSRLDPNSAEAKALKEGIENLADSLSSPAVSLAYQAGIVGSGKQFTRQLEAYTPETAATTPSTKSVPTAAAAPATEAKTTVSTPAGTKSIAPPTAPTPAKSVPVKTTEELRAQVEADNAAKAAAAKAAVEKAQAERAQAAKTQAERDAAAKAQADKNKAADRVADKAIAGKAAAQASKEKASSTAGASAGRSGGRDQQGSTGGANATRRAEGGLISKPQKAIRNKKGLAS